MGRVILLVTPSVTKPVVESAMGSGSASRLRTKQRSGSSLSGWRLPLSWRGLYSTDGDLSISKPRTDPADSAPERDATPAEMRALAHPLRLRILRLTLNAPMTNKQIAARLERDPGTVLHHVRMLVGSGFLTAETVRPGKRGALERPYRASGKSWQIRMLPSPQHSASVIDAVRDELVEGGPDAVLATLRLGVRLSAADIADLRLRIAALGEEFVLRDDPAGEPIGILAVAHRRRP